MIDCKTAREKISALIDNEIEENEVAPVLSHLESCYNCRSEYIEFLRLQKQMKGISIPGPGKEWFEEFHKRTSRRITGLIGKIFFFASYIILIVFALFQLFTSPQESLALKLIIGGIITGFLILLGVTIADRIYEGKNDRYKGVIK
jgi:predicted anti-sigma-YlaC factor YlaD